MKWHFVVIQFCLWAIFFDTSVKAAMSEQQLKSAVKLVRNMCQPKSKATDEDIDKMHQGDWNVDRTAMCYMHCALTSQRLMNKENIPNYDLAVSLANKNLPVALREPTLDSIEKCKDSAKTLDDKCVAAYEISKCFYDAHPEAYFLP